MLKQVLCGITLLIAASVSQAQNLAGKYTCQGTDPGLKTDYKGTLEVTKFKAYYAFKWVLTNGQQATGMGLQKGDIISVAYIVFEDGKVNAGKQTLGVQQYAINSKTHELSGDWLEQGQTLTGRETCKKK